MDKRVKYDLMNPTIKKGLTALAQGVGGYHRTKSAVMYFNKHGFKMTSNNVYDLFRRALSKSPNLRKLNNNYHNEVETKQKNNRIKSAEKYRKNKKAKVENLIKENNDLKNKNAQLTNTVNNLKNKANDYTYVGVGLNGISQRFHLYTRVTAHQQAPTYALDMNGNPTLMTKDFKLPILQPNQNQNYQPNYNSQPKNNGNYNPNSTPDFRNM